MVRGTMDKARKKDHATDADWTCPVEEPNWEPQSTWLYNYRILVLLGLRQRVQKVKNLGKVYQIQQKKDENPGKFLECIYQTFRQYTDLDPEAEENQRMVNMIFIGQTTDDIRTKLQKTEGGPGKEISELMELAYKVYINQAQKEKKEAQKARRNAIFLSEALRLEKGKGRESCGRGW